MLTLATCSFNTPSITMNMVKSFYKLNDFYCEFLITDNSTNEDTVKLLEEANIPYLRNPGYHHSIGVDVLLEKCTTKYMLLVDTDIIFLKSISDIYYKFKESKTAICGVLQGSRGAYNLYDRICPWFCFIDVETTNSYNLKYYDPVRFSQHLHEVKATKIYDVGATFLEDIVKLNLGVLSITEEEQNSYLHHWEGMSWRKECDIKEISQLGINTLIDYNNFVQNSDYKVTK